VLDAARGTTEGHKRQVRTSTQPAERQ